jgi:hypothetical protein
MAVKRFFTDADFRGDFVHINAGEALPAKTFIRTV